MLNILPCLDSTEHAAARQRELKIPRPMAVELGTSAVEAAKSGRYIDHDGHVVDWEDAVKAACAAKVSIPPDAPLSPRKPQTFPTTRIQVANMTTLAAAHHLVDNGLHPLALNFANGIQPGGGFLSGSLAQEEVLCRSSALYLTLVDDPMYAYHRGRPQPDSTAWTILSPHVPIFRTDDGTPLAQPWQLSFITCAAPYAPTVGQPESADLLAQRIRRVLAVAQDYGYSALVLGAWGCGAFGNDPQRTAHDFRHALETEFDGAFSDVWFAVTDWSETRKFLGPFRTVFG